MAEPRQQCFPWCLCYRCRRRRRKTREAQKRYRKRHAERLREKQRAWHLENKGRLNERSRKWIETRRRLVVEILLARDGRACPWCGDRLEEPFNGEATHIDHRIPRAKGGEGEPLILPVHENLQLMHAGCNLEKRDEWDDTQQAEQLEPEEVPF